MSDQAVAVHNDQLTMGTGTNMLELTSHVIRGKFNYMANSDFCTKFDTWILSFMSVFISNYIE